jgi:hypothetical protein
MTTMPNVVNSANSSQMSTPIKNLPLKTSQQQEHDIEDPLIQGVLKEFEDTAMANAPPPEMISPPHEEIQYQPPPPVSMPQLQPEPMQINNLDFNTKNSDKKLFDIELVKRAAIVTIILILFQNNNILNMVLSRVPSSVSVHTSGKEIFINSFLVFLIVYTLMYFDFV